MAPTLVQAAVLLLFGGLAVRKSPSRASKALEAHRALNATILVEMATNIVSFDSLAAAMISSLDNLLS